MFVGNGCKESHLDIQSRLFQDTQFFSVSFSVYALHMVFSVLA